MNDFTDDEDYEDSYVHTEVSSEIIEDSNSELSHEDSDDESYLERTPNVKRHNSLRKKKSQVISDSDVSTDADCSTSTSKKKNSKQNGSSTSSSRNIVDNSLISESSEGDEELLTKKHISEKNGFKSVDLNGDNLSRNVNRGSHDLESSSEEDIRNKVKFRPRNKIGVIKSDSESDMESDDAKCNIEAPDSEEKNIHSRQNVSPEEIDEITNKLNSSTISNEFKRVENEGIVNSTLLDIENHSRSPGHQVLSKRSLNRSRDTPRIIKHMRESSTPNNIQSVKSSLERNMLKDALLTPREATQVISSSSTSPNSSIEVSSEEDDVIEVSSEERDIAVRVVPPLPSRKVIKQSTLECMLPKKNSPEEQKIVKQEAKENVVEVTSEELQAQKQKVKEIESNLLKAKHLLRTVNMENLPDKGAMIKIRHVSLEQSLKVEAQKLSEMAAICKDVPQTSKTETQNKIVSWEEIETKAGAVLPRTFGKQAMSTYNAQRALTMDRLQQLHGSLETCPQEDTFSEDPRGLKVELMTHQRRALAWLMWREKQKPSGGILADDMGLGKTLTMIALMLKTMEVENQNDDSDNENNPSRSSKYNGGTLVVCPASLINQWSVELERRTKRGLASCEVYHGPKRQTKAKKLAEYDMVITTYSIVMNEFEKGTIFGVNWRRIITDEAHQIRNYKSQTSTAVCHLAGKSRWALTGTPVHNKELDMYALLKFLRCTPFDDIQVWKRWVGDKSTGGQERLHTVISSLMLRRTKAELMEKGTLNSMPERKWELIPVQLDKNEVDVYQRILIFSRTLFAQFLHQRAEKNQDVANLNYASLSDLSKGQKPNEEYFKMRQKLLRLHKVRDIKQHEILVLLLRLRQICCHPSLITGMLHEDMEDLNAEDEPEEMNILEQLNKLALDNDEHNPDLSNPALNLGSQEDTPGLKEATRGFLNPSNPVFSKERISSKIKVMLDVLKERVLMENDKAIIVSQWPSFLRLIAFHLKQQYINFDQLDGTIPVNKRMAIINRLNDPNDKVKILLLSLTAGGVGLNLVGANHLFLLDLHWNPQLENQAQDRIYRVGQLKPVFVYKFMATDTIEKRILDLQEKKLDIANSMLTGTKQVIGSKLSLQDLKLLFDM